jgi:hypothetical protein
MKKNAKALAREYREKKREKNAKEYVRGYYERKREFAEEVLDFIDDVPLGILCRFDLRMCLDGQWFDGSCIAYPLGFNRESVKLRILASDIGEPIGVPEHLWSRGKDPCMVAVSFKSIRNFRPFDEKDIVTCLQYPLRTRLLESMLKGNDIKLKIKK